MPQYTYAELVNLAQAAGLPLDKAKTAALIAEAESGGNSARLNNNPATGDYSVGLWQINLFGNLAKSRPSEQALYDPLTNAKEMAVLSGGGTNFSAWSTYKSGTYKNQSTIGQTQLDAFSSTNSNPIADAINSTVKNIGSFTIDFGMRAAFIGVGGLLIVIGFYVIAAPQIKQAAGTAVKAKAAGI